MRLSPLPPLSLILSLRLSQLRMLGLLPSQMMLVGLVMLAHSQLQMMKSIYMNPVIGWAMMMTRGNLALTNMETPMS